MTLRAKSLSILILGETKYIGTVVRRFDEGKKGPVILFSGDIVKSAEGVRGGGVEDQGREA